MTRAWNVDRVIGGKRSPLWLDRAAAELARRQYGRVSRAQLLELGFGADAIDHRIRSGRLHLVHRGVYAVGHAGVTQEGIWLAAVLAGGRDAALSWWSAGALWRVHGHGGPMSDVTVPRKRRSRLGIRFHRAALPADEVTEHRGIPVTPLRARSSICRLTCGRARSSGRSTRPTSRGSGAHSRSTTCSSATRANRATGRCAKPSPTVARRPP